MTTDFLIIGSGIVGMTIALELSNQHPSSKITIIEKENDIGKHASGRNSGVIHSGIYYKPGSLKSRMCIDGSKKLIQWSEDHNVSIKKAGKCIIPTKEDDFDTLIKLCNRGQEVGVENYLINNNGLKRVEPSAWSCNNNALYLPQVHTIDIHELLEKIREELIDKKVHIEYSSRAVTKNNLVFSNGKKFSYGFLINAAGMYCDEIAHGLDVAHKYGIIPFKGTYYELIGDIPINGLVYPVPDLNMPFLGIHFTKSVNGKVYIGPNALSCLGKENYKRFQGANFDDTNNMLKCIINMYFRKPNMRRYIHSEIFNLFKFNFMRNAKKLVPKLKSCNVVASSKCGIRAQLFDKKTLNLVDDFLVIPKNNEAHILNAVSPAMTCSMSFAKYVVDNYVG